MAAAAAVEAVGVNVPSPDLNGPQVAVDVMARYETERQKRLKSTGTSQFVDLGTSEKYIKFVADPWVEEGTHVKQVVSDGGHVKALILGAGYGGLLFADALLKAGFGVEDLMIVDPAGGFGGAW
jgi:predicted alpha/beta superfamily hydrolase